MATVIELKAEAEALGIKTTSRMRKPEIEQAIADKRRENAASAREQAKKTLAATLTDPRMVAAIAEGMPTDRAESDSDKINTPTPSATPAVTLTRAQRASQAGARGMSAQPMDNFTRQSNYMDQIGRHVSDPFMTPREVTPAQARRMRKKANKAVGRSDRASLTMI